MVPRTLRPEGCFPRVFTYNPRVMTAMTLEVKARDLNESPEELRAAGVLPAVVYGSKDEAIAISVPRSVFEKLFREAGETTVVTLTGLGDKKETLIHDVQIHPVTGAALHADFYALAKGQKVTLNIPLEFTGSAPAEKQGHIIVKALHEIEIEVAPAELPHSLAVDLSKLENVGDHIVASQVTLPPSARLITNADEIVASVTEFKEEKAEEPVLPAAEGAPAEGAAAAPQEGEEKKAE